MTTVETSPGSYRTNTDEVDALSLNVAAELSGAEAAVSAVCELVDYSTGTDVTATAFSGAAAVNSNVVTRTFDARSLPAGVYRWVWNVTLNTAAVRSFVTVLYVESHD